MTNGISKGITKENIVKVTLELIKDKENIRSVNLREIARVLGCAHTNLYNHFSNFDEILWNALDEVLLRSSEFVIRGVDDIKKPDHKLEHFYSRIIEFYLGNRGWFRLFWMEKLHGQRSDNNIALTTAIVEKYVAVLMDILQKVYDTELTNQKTMYIFHTVHSYLYGEISIYISGRGLITEEKTFKDYIRKECIKLTRLLVSSID